jgi:hypothetical protein
LSLVPPADVESSSQWALMLEAGAQNLESVLGPLAEAIVCEAEGTAQYEAAMQRMGLPLPPLNAQVWPLSVGVATQLPAPSAAALRYEPNCAVSLLLSRPACHSASQVQHCHALPLVGLCGGPDEPPSHEGQAPSHHTQAPGSELRGTRSIG